MSDPTLVLTFDTLRIRVAEFLGVAYYGAAGDQAAQLPVEAHDLDKVGRLVNDGYRRFMTDNERGWNFLTVPFSLTFGTGTVSADNARYYAPDDFFGIQVAPFTYGASGPRANITPTSEQEIRELQSASNTTGQPTVSAARAINTTAATTSQRWEFIFWPTPSGTETVTAMYKRFPAAMTVATDRSVAGFQHDTTLLEAVLAAAEVSVGDSQGPHEVAYQRELKKSQRMDARSSAPRIQDYGDRSEDRGGGRRRKDQYGVSTYNGNSIL